MTPTELFTQLYDAFAEEYERTRVPHFRPFVKKLLQLYDTRPNSRVLDAGTGTGLAATMIAPRVGHGGKVIGVDVSEAQLNIARRKAHGYGFTQCEFQVGDITQLEFPNDEFDLVICSFAHFGDPPALFTEFRRVLKPGGVLLDQHWMSHAPPEQTYDDTLAQFRMEPPSENLAQVRAAQAQNGETWKAFAAPGEYERVLPSVGFSEMKSQVVSLPQHFDGAHAYAEWRNVSPTNRWELDAMGTERRAEFMKSVLDALRPFENSTGLEFEWSAVQIVARK
jgi:ubiquinone/menaquinone biosynthesis C-methylase UbiE